MKNEPFQLLNWSIVNGECFYLALHYAYLYFQPYRITIDSKKSIVCTYKETNTAQRIYVPKKTEFFYTIQVLYCVIQYKIFYYCNTQVFLLFLTIQFLYELKTAWTAQNKNNVWVDFHNKH